MAAKGVHVKELDALPELCEVDDFYLEMYNVCGTSVTEIRSYCEILELTAEETLDAIKVLSLCQ